MELQVLLKFSRFVYLRDNEENRDHREGEGEKNEF